MVNKISSLVILLLLQCGLIVWLYSADLSANKQQQPDSGLVQLDAGKIESIIIKDEASKAVTLKKTDNGWILPDYHQLAVDLGLLEQLLEKLNSIQTIWPVASSDGAAERFQVSKHKFRRHLIFSTADKGSTELYLGESPGLRKIYARNANNPDIYAIEFGLYLAPTSAEAWFDKRLLKVRKRIDKIQGKDFVINKQADAWSLEGMQENQVIDQARLDALVSALAYPQVKSVASEKRVQELEGKKPVAHYKIQAGDDEISYDYFRIKDDVILKSSLSDLYFVIPVYVHETLLGNERDKLLKVRSQGE